jgi:hypothetical protein
MKRVHLMLSASGLVLALAMASWAQVKVLPTHTVTMAGTVVAMTVDVPESAKRFNEIKVGDKVKATYNNNVTVRLKPAGEPAVDTAKTAKAVGEGRGRGPGPWPRWSGP